MKDAKLPASDSYHPYKISNLKDENYSAAYLSLIFGEEEEGDWKLKIMPKALRDVFEALGEPNMSAEYAGIAFVKVRYFLVGRRKCDNLCFGKLAEGSGIEVICCG